MIDLLFSLLFVCLFTLFYVLFADKKARLDSSLSKQVESCEILESDELSFRTNIECDQVTREIETIQEKKYVEETLPIDQETKCNDEDVTVDLLEIPQGVFETIDLSDNFQTKENVEKLEREITIQDIEPCICTAVDEPTATLTQSETTMDYQMEEQINEDLDKTDTHFIPKQLLEEKESFEDETIQVELSETFFSFTEKDKLSETTSTSSQQEDQSNDILKFETTTTTTNEVIMSKEPKKDNQSEHTFETIDLQLPIHDQTVIVDLEMFQCYYGVANSSIPKGCLLSTIGIPTTLCNRTYREYGKYKKIGQTPFRYHFVMERKGSHLIDFLSFIFDEKLKLVDDFPLLVIGSENDQENEIIIEDLTLHLKHKISHIYMAKPSEMAMYALGKEQGIVLHCDGHSSYIVPVYACWSISKLVTKIDHINGQNLTELYNETQTTADTVNIPHYEIVQNVDKIVKLMGEEMNEIVISGRPLSDNLKDLATLPPIPNQNMHFDLYETLPFRGACNFANSEAIKSLWLSRDEDFKHGDLRHCRI